MSRGFLSLLVALLCSAAFAADGPTARPKKNVVLFVVDDMGLDAGCYGNRAIRTPYLDRLAAEGTRFDRAFCTTASCSASRSVILTGLHNHANGQYGHQHSYHNFHTFDSLRSLPVLLSDAGYRTCSIGKVHVQPESVYKFDVYANDGAMGARNTVRMAENAGEFINSVDAQKEPQPFFIYFCPSDPHRAAKGFANDRKYPGVEEVAYEPDDVSMPHFLPDQPEVRQELAEYYQAISRLDQGLGRLMEVLEETGHGHDTLILFLSDNGMPFPGSKTTLYEPGMHLPLVVRSPDQKERGQASRVMVTWADLVPTILEYTGVKGPKYALHGRSFLDAIHGEELPDSEVYASHTFHEITMYYPMRVVRTNRYKYILNLAHQLPYPFASDLYDSPTWQGVLERGDKTFGRRTTEAFLHRPRHELYDLQADPYEAVNLAEDPQHADILAELQRKLKSWQEKTGDPWIVKYRYE